MIRRTHKKSRNGCNECKRSRKKCDESHPSCVNCKISKRLCSYTLSTVRQGSSHKEFVVLTGPNLSIAAGSALPRSTSQSHSAEPSHQSPSPIPTGPLTGPYVNMLHLELFHNVSSNAMSFFADGSSKDLWVATVLRYAFKFPYIMYSVLSLSAFNLSIKVPSRSKLYLTESNTLQAHALSLFNATMLGSKGVTKENIIPAFLFSAAIGLHYFCDTFTTPSPDLATFLDRFIQSIHLLRGVRALIGNSWDFIRKSDIECLLQPDSSHLPPLKDDKAQAFQALFVKLTECQSLSLAEREVLTDAVASLIKVYNSRPRKDTNDGPPNGGLVTTWPITLSAEYTKMLDERNPEALVILAYFSVLLHWRRGFWPVGNAGKSLLGVIGEVLSEEWDEWLAVPRRIVFGL